MHDAISLPGVSSADLGGPELAGLGQSVEDLKRRENSRALGPEMQVSQAQVGEGQERMVSERRGTGSHGATLSAGGVRQQLPVDKDSIRSLGSASTQVQRPRDYDSSSQQNPRTRNCGSTSDLSDVLKINRHELLGSESQRSRGLEHQPHVGMDSKHLGRATPRAQGERTYRLPRLQDVRGNIFSLPQGQATRDYLSAVADGQGVKDLGLVAKDKNGPRVHGTVTVENHDYRGSLQVQERGSYGPVIPGASGTQSLGVTTEERQEGKGFTADDQEAKHLSHAEHEVIKPKALSIPGQTGRDTQATSKSKALSFYTITMSIFSLKLLCYDISSPLFFLRLLSDAIFPGACCLWKVVSL